MTTHQWPFAENTLFECCHCEHQCTQAEKQTLTRNELTTYICPKCGNAEFYQVKKEDTK